MTETSSGTPQQPNTTASSRVLLIGAGLIAAIIGAAVFINRPSPADIQPEPSPPLVSPPPAAIELAPASEAQLDAPEVIAPSDPPIEPIENPLPMLEESDDPVRDALGDIPMGTIGQQYLIPSNIIERSASLIYLTSKGDVPYKLLPVARPAKPFSISDDGTQVVADASGFARYDVLAQWLESLDLDSILLSLQPFLPLFREAWSYYGEPPEDFDFAVVIALDLIASTPSVDTTEARLIKKEAVWVYEDPSIEGLAPIQKQVLRMGPVNAAVVKAKADEAQALWRQQIMATP
jgi:hypothetical protein